MGRGVDEMAYTVKFTIENQDRDTHHVITTRCKNGEAAGVITSFHWSERPPGTITYMVRYPDLQPQQQRRTR